MKTVQEYFREADIDELIRLYLCEHPVNIDKIKELEQQSVGQIMQVIKDKLARYIERLRTITPSTDDEYYVFFAHKTMGKYGYEISYSLAYLEDILKKDINEIQTYSYILSKHEEIVQYQVADTELTKQNIENLLIDIMYEASFFGYEQEYLDAEKTALDKALKEPMDQEGISFEEFEEKMCDEFGWEKSEIDEVEEEYYKKAVCADYDYERYSITKELNAIKKTIEQDHENNE